MKLAKLMVGLIAIGTLSNIGSAFAEEHPIKEHKHEFVKRCLASLELTEDQKPAVKGLVKASKESLRNIKSPKKNRQKAQHFMVEMLDEPTFNEEAVSAHIDERMQKVKRVSMLKAQLKYDIYQVLSDEQKTIFKESEQCQPKKKARTNMHR